MAAPAKAQSTEQEGCGKGKGSKMDQQTEQRLRKALQEFLPETLQRIHYEERGGNGSVILDSQVFGTVPQKRGYFAASREDLDNLVDVFVKMFKD